VAEIAKTRARMKVESAGNTLESSVEDFPGTLIQKMEIS
jgi:hypothetical protein